MPLFRHAERAAAAYFDAIIAAIRFLFISDVFHY